MSPASMMRGYIAIVLSVRLSVRPYEFHIVNTCYTIAYKALLLALMLSVIIFNTLTPQNLILTLILA